MAIGDVGIVTPEGTFDFFFNIYLASNHPINDNYVPTPGFYPLEFPDERDIIVEQVPPGNHVASASIRRQQSLPASSLQCVLCRAEI